MSPRPRRSTTSVTSYYFVWLRVPILRFKSLFYPVAQSVYCATRPYIQEESLSPVCQIVISAQEVTTCLTSQLLRVDPYRERQPRLCQSNTKNGLAFQNSTCQSSDRVAYLDKEIMFSNQWLALDTHRGVDLPIDCSFS